MSMSHTRSAGNRLEGSGKSLTQDQNALRMATIRGVERIVLWMSKLQRQGALAAFALMIIASPLRGWTQAPAPSEVIRPMLTDLNTSVSGLNISKWKAPGPVKNAAQDNVGSIQRDITGALPALLDQANTAPGSLAPAFAVYRNVDALYDVLLRLSETADLAAPDNESQALQAALGRLSGARKQLSDALMQTATERETELVKLRSVVAAQTAAAPAQQATPAKTVVDDGPATAAPKKRKKKPAAPPAAAPQ